MEQTRLIFFDIDGTLTCSHNGFIPFNEAILKSFGFPGGIRTVVTDGNTDPLSLEEIFAVARHQVKITQEKWRGFEEHHGCLSDLTSTKSVIESLFGLF